MTEKYNWVGTTLAVTGSVISLIGAVANNLYLNPLLARQLWVISNPLLLVWAIGLWKKQWSDGLGVKSIIGMYLFYTVTGAISLGII